MKRDSEPLFLELSILKYTLEIFVPKGQNIHFEKITTMCVKL